MSGNPGSPSCGSLKGDPLFWFIADRGEPVNGGWRERASHSGTYVQGNIPFTIFLFLRRR
jgi:hypothetical protein